jgi:hypothetical protein
VFFEPDFALAVPFIIRRGPRDGIECYPKKPVSLLERNIKINDYPPDGRSARQN